MDCVHEYIFAPHRVCSKCGLIDDDIRFMPTKTIVSRYNTRNAYDKATNTDPLPPLFVLDGRCEEVKIGAKVHRIAADWAAKRILIATSRIRFICRTLNAEFLEECAIEQCLKWLKHPWTTNPKDPHTNLYQAFAFTAVWYSMRKYHYPLTFKRYLDIVNEFGTVKHFNTKFLKISLGCKIEFPKHSLPQITANYCEQFRYDAEYQNRLWQMTEKAKQFNTILIQKATKIAKKIPCQGNPQIMGLSIMVYTACQLQNYMIAHDIGRKLPASDIIGDVRFTKLFGVGRNYINRRITTLLPQLQRCVKWEA
jgi:hypothetical protein